MMGFIARLGTTQCTFLFKMYYGIHRVHWIGYITHSFSIQAVLKKMVCSIFSALFREQGVLLDGADGSLNHFGSE